VQMAVMNGIESAAKNAEGFHLNKVQVTGPGFQREC
jgi:hypothetical protein